MRFVIGPVSAASAQAWLDYAREILARLDSIAPGAPCSSPEIREVFEHYLDEWDEVAYVSGDRPFQWATEIAPEVAEYHVHAFNQIAIALADRERQTGVRMAPRAADEFYTSLVQGVVAALGDGPPSSAEYAQHLSEFWPFPASV